MMFWKIKTLWLRRLLMALAVVPVLAIYIVLNIGALGLEILAAAFYEIRIFCGDMRRSLGQFYTDFKYLWKFETFPGEGE